MSQEYSVVEFAEEGNEEVCPGGELVNQAFDKVFEDDLAGAKAYAYKMLEKGKKRAKKLKLQGYNLAVLNFYGHCFLRIK